VYLADKMTQGSTLKDAMKASIQELTASHLPGGDCRTLGECQGRHGREAMVLTKAIASSALASEEVAIRTFSAHEIRHVRSVRGRRARVGR